MLLPYPDNALEPYIDKRTVDIHYNKHYKNYLNKLNELLLKEKIDYSKEEVIKNIDNINMENRGLIIYNLGGVINHELYFLSMGTNNHEPSGNLKNKINAQYGSFTKFKEEFIKVANTLVGSGYTFLVLNDKKLDIVNMPNQETPYLYGFIPLLALDLWEHAYYLKYQNKRDEYIDNFFKIISFKKTEEIYEKVL